MEQRFSIHYEETHVTVTPIRQVARAAVASSLFGSVKLFVYAEVLIPYGHILFAFAQEDAAKTRKIVALERLEETLYGLLQVERLPLKEIEALSELSAHSVQVTPVETDDWWQAVLANDEDEIHDELTFDLGPQPLQESPIKDSGETIEVFLQSINSVYFTTLYESKAPLVFFAKSSLPRLRKTMLSRGFQEQIVLAHILEHIFPTDADFDAKYKAFIPTFVKGEMVGLPFQYDTTCLKDGELAHIQAWLDACIESTAQPRPDTVLSTSLTPLKTREAQLMVILLLELLTFDQASKAIELRIDMLLDRLAIWQTVNFTQDDLLKSFCLEVILPYYALRLPEVTTAIQLKCVPQDLLAFEPPPTPAKIKKRVRATVKSNAAVSLKRTISAPANLLSEKKTVPKKRSLGREVSMTKKIPNFELAKSSKTAPKRGLSFEERRKQRVEQEERERIQVDATPAKPRPHGMAMPNDHDEAVALLAAQFVAQRESKASFMSVVETPSKGSTIRPPPGAAVGETPLAGLKTPTRGSHIARTPVRDRVLLDTPTRGSAPLFNIASPTLPPPRPKNLFSDSGQKKRSHGEMRGAPSLQKTVSLPTMTTHASPFMVEQIEEEGDTVAAASPVGKSGHDAVEEKATKLQEVLDWL
ncbi:hypothetical protein BCR37DRAFT_395972 [Protomyces lactucae-debilis]|uniref:DNA replication regulator Sld3 C-terminal domain-containing protein n=1 Tax=Protomyces lactucae-debilis TaxID=2754530 RepID=A0A1Y2EPJ8_PROLT|nr:uncharacterized protein BCR37DRAFT_395972 [Protomyces lactucae-debilis]ORY73469.1 hypothetical protein BCR37DRAFT_395972 [Protomyces lactucae-debilis]